MQFHVYQSADQPDHYFVTDQDAETAKLPGGLIDVGMFPELGDKRVAFNEGIAKSAIRSQGFYEFTAMSDMLMETPG